MGFWIKIAIFKQLIIKMTTKWLLNRCWHVNVDNSHMLMSLFFHKTISQTQCTGWAVEERLVHQTLIQNQFSFKWPFTVIGSTHQSFEAFVDIFHHHKKHEITHYKTIWLLHTDPNMNRWTAVGISPYEVWCLSQTDSDVMTEESLNKESLSPRSNVLDTARRPSGLQH